MYIVDTFISLLTLVLIQSDQNQILDPLFFFIAATV